MGCVAMVGRNDPCPCGSGKKYKKCCERVVAIRTAEQVREERELKAKIDLLQDLIQWFKKQFSRESEENWCRKFKEDLHLPLDRPIPRHFAHAYQFWLLFDAPCLDGLRPVEARLERGIHSSDRDRWMELCQIHLDCYEVKEERGDRLVLCSLSDGGTYSVRRLEGLSAGILLFTRLSRLGNRHELFGPYTSFGVEMRGEIEVYIKNRPHDGELNREFWQQNGLQILGWMMQRAHEMEQLEKIAATAGAEREMASTLEKETVPASIPEKKELLPQVPVLSADEAGLPAVVAQQLEQFENRYVSRFQPRTQELYQSSLGLFRDYVGSHFGKHFTWSELKEEAFSHFLGVWYVDQGVGGSIRSKIFLNTMKHLFRWIRDEAICDLYPAFASVYSNLIHDLPRSFEAQKWLRENGVRQEPEEPNLAAKGTYMLAISSAGASLDTGETWIPVQLNTRSWPPSWLENRFWVRGTIHLQKDESVMTEVEAVYPFFQMKQVEVVS
jgi:hypothetical protein